MPDSKITALTSIGTSTDPANDPLVLVDVSDTSMAASGTTKKVTLNQLLATSPTATLASATISGDLTVDTSTLKVDSTNNRVGVGTATPNDVLEVVGNGATGVRVSRAGLSTQYATLSAGATGPTLDASSALSELTFGIAGSNKMTLNSTGLGVGVTPTAKLDVNGTVIIRDTFSLLMGFGNQQRILAGGTSDNTYLTFSQWTGAAYTERMRIDQSGNVGVGVTPSGSGGCLQLKSGITFPATQVASSDANTLDDYEEGTFTATLKGGTADPTTPVTTTGRYTKIGRLVSIQIYFNNVNTTGASGSISVSGLPFSSASSIYNSGSAVSGDMATFTGTLGCWLSPSSSTIDLLSSVSNGSITGATHNAGASRYLAININYTV